MSSPAELLSDYGLGMKQDLPRNQMPRGAVWNLRDYIPRILGAPIRKRGGWTFGSPLTGGGGHALNVAYAPFTAGPQLVKVNSSGNLYRVTSDTSESLVGALGVYPWPAAFYRERLFFGESGLALSYYNGSSIATVATAPKARHLGVYKDRLVLSRGMVGATDYPQRTWFADAGDPLSYDLTNSYIDASFPVNGTAMLRNMVLLFGDGSTERILGSTPPTALDIGDMERGTAFNVGCIDARSIAYYGEMVIFANGEGIWRSDGSIPENLARGGALRRYWLDLMANWQTGWILAGGVLADTYFISIVDQDGVFLDCLALDLGSLSWYRVANVPATMFASAIGAAEELYWSHRTLPTLARLAPIFRPSAAQGSDADGTPVLPLIETPYEEGSAGIKRWADLYLNYLLDGSGVGTNPSMQIGVILDPEETVYTTIGALPQATSFRRDTLPIRYDSVGIALRFQQLLASGDTRMYEISALVNPLEPSKVR